MSRESEQFSTEIVKRGVEDSGPNAGSLSFSVRVKPSLPDFLSSVNMKHVKLGYGYLISHGSYFFFLMAPLLVAVSMGAHVGKIMTWKDVSQFYDLILTQALFVLGLFCTLYFYVDLTPRSTYLLDFACFRPPNELKVILKSQC